MTTALSNHPPDHFPRHKTSAQTKIIATLGPATDNGEVLEALLKAGVSGFRINLAAIGRESALKAVYAIRSISTELQRPVSLILEVLVPRAGSGSGAGSESDWADLRFGLECGVDWLAVESGRDGTAVRQTRQFLIAQKRSNVSILARIESSALLLAPDQIIQDADGIILDGGNRTGEFPEAELHGSWAGVVQKCVSARKPVLVAWAGVDADLTPALSLQPDAIILMEETSVGASLLQRVHSLDGLMGRPKPGDPHETPINVVLAGELDRAVAGTFRQVDESKAEAIVFLTRSGTAASLGAALRPGQTRVFVFTPDARLARKLRLHYALEPIVLPFCAQLKATIHVAEKILRKRNLLGPGARAVFLTDTVDQESPGSSVQLRTLA